MWKTSVSLSLITLLAVIGLTSTKSMNMHTHFNPAGGVAPKNTAESASWASTRVPGQLLFTAADFDVAQLIGSANPSLQGIEVNDPVYVAARPDQMGGPLAHRDEASGTIPHARPPQLHMDTVYYIDAIYEVHGCYELAPSCAWAVDWHGGVGDPWDWAFWECSNTSANGPWSYIQGGRAHIDAWYFETPYFDPNATAWMKVTLATAGITHAVSDVIETVGGCPYLGG